MIHRPLLIIALLMVVGSLAMDNETYWNRRDIVLQQENTMMLGHSIVLTADEKAMNDVLMGFKDSEMEIGFQTLDFPPSVNFMTVKDKYEASPVFQMIQAMPKGAALHLHDISMSSNNWVVKELSYWDDLYICTTLDGDTLLRYFAVADGSCQWELVSDVRASYPTPQDFDDFLLSRLTLTTDDPQAAYPDLNAVWAAFGSKMATISGVLAFDQAWDAYLYHALDEFRMDNVQYVEFRGVLAPFYTDNGSDVTEPVEIMETYVSSASRFASDHSDDYFGTRYIYGPTRGVDESTVVTYVENAATLRETYPDFVAGFDLVGQEDLGRPLRDFIDILLTISEQRVDIPVFYHSGETDWEGMSTDENIIDALLLNATRLGHAYAISKHPLALQMVLEKDVALEVCPISNQVLKLVDDLRNHPMAGLMAQDFPIVVSADDPGTWGSMGLSYDWYAAFMGLGGAHADLRFLKQLAINSIKYSSLDEIKKTELMLMWQTGWDQFIQTSLRLYKPGKFSQAYPRNSLRSNEI